MTNTAEQRNVPRVEPRHRMRIALEHGHVSVGEMAKVLGVGRDTVGNYLAGRTKPRLGDLRVWAMRTGVPLEWLQYGDIEPDGGIPNTGAHNLGYVRRLTFASAANVLVAA